jgi:hypothetical protein
MVLDINIKLTTSSGRKEEIKMTLYCMLVAITLIAGVIGVFSFLFWLVSGFDCPPVAVVALLCLVTVIGVSVKRADIEKAETTRVEETVVGTITSKDMVSDEHSVECFVSIICSDDGSATTLWVTHGEYARVQEGDNVSVIKTAETLFGNTVYSYEIIV